MIDSKIRKCTIFTNKPAYFLLSKQTCAHWFLLEYQDTPTLLWGTSAQGQPQKHTILHQLFHHNWSWRTHVSLCLVLILMEATGLINIIFFNRDVLGSCPCTLTAEFSCLLKWQWLVFSFYFQTNQWNFDDVCIHFQRWSQTALNECEEAGSSATSPGIWELLFLLIRWFILFFLRQQ